MTLLLNLLISKKNKIKQTNINFIKIFWIPNEIEESNYIISEFIRKEMKPHTFAESLILSVYKAV